MISRRYSELIRLESFEERFEYLRLQGDVGRSTFGFDRYINQKFYQSRQWKDVRNFVLLRDNGCDLGVNGHEIAVSPLIHHMNPMEASDIIHGEEWVLDPEFLITTTHNTHNAIHYGDKSLMPKVAVERKAGDTKLW
jgi:hypothetical protein